MWTEVILATQPTELRGKVINGVIILENGGTLPEGTLVKIEPVASSEPAETVNEIGQLRKMLLGHAGVLADSELPTDLAENLDHYLYGTPKRS
jgi:hypothetical protein